MEDTTKQTINTLISNRKAIECAKVTLSNAIYQSECGVNAGLRKIFSNQADWLSILVYLAEKQLMHEVSDEKGSFN
jgi:hypothetical protein